jgi:hypothetical protein
MNCVKRLIPFSVLTVFFTSCVKEIPFNNASSEEMLVVNSFITPDSLFEVDLSHTKAFFGKETCFHAVPGATIDLYEEGTEIGTLPYIETNGDSVSVYKSASFYPGAGKTYRVEVSADGYDAVSCETTIPEPMKIIRFDTTDTKIRTTLPLTLTFRDSALVDNYYRIILTATLGYSDLLWNEETQQEDSVIIVLSETVGTFLDSEDPLLDGEGNADDYLFGSAGNVYNIFSDKLIAGQTYAFGFKYASAYLNTKTLDTDKGEFYKMEVQFQSISYDEYMYLLTYTNYEWNDGDALTEPVQVYTNVTNGTGIFAGYSTERSTILVGEYPKDGVTYHDSDESGSSPDL